MNYDKYYKAEHIQKQLRKLAELNKMITFSHDITIAGTQYQSSGTEKSVFKLADLDESIRTAVEKAITDTVLKCEEQLTEEFSRL